MFKGLIEPSFKPFEPQTVVDAIDARIEGLHRDPDLHDETTTGRLHELDGFAQLSRMAASDEYGYDFPRFVEATIGENPVPGLVNC